MASEALFWLKDFGEYARSLAKQGITQTLRGGVDYGDPKFEQAAKRAVARLHPPEMRLRLEQVLVETPSTKTLRFRRVDGPAPPFRPGQYVDLHVCIDGLRTSRPYSISSRPGVGYLDLTVRDKPGGIVSAYLLSALSIGDELESSGPSGQFYYEPLIDGKKLVLLAGGSGITPFMSIIRDATAAARPIEIVLLYGSRRPDDVIFGQELAELGRANGRLRAVPVISEPPAGYAGVTGLLDARLIREQVGEVKDKTFYVCGPRAMVELVSPALAELGVPRRRVRHELHGPIPDITRHPRWPAGLSPDTMFAVEIDGLKTIQARAGTPLLDSLEGQGVAVPCLCRSGACSACRIRVVHGRVLQTDDARVREADLTHGYVHTCASYPLENLTIRL